MRSARFVPVVLLILGAHACANLETIDPGICGNGAVEPGEDCEPGLDKRCVPAGVRDECRIRCEPAAADPGCPATMVCGVSELCESHSLRFESSDSLEVRANVVLGAADLDGDGALDLVATGLGSLAVVHVGPGRRLESPITLHATRALPHAAQLTTDATGALDAPYDLVAGHGGLLVHRGSEDRMYGPVTYSPVPRPGDAGSFELAAFDALPPYVDSGGTLRHLGEEVVAASRDGISTLSETLLEWESTEWSEGQTGELGRSIVVADLLPRAESADCDELLVRRGTGRDIDVYSTCGSDFDATEPVGTYTIGSVPAAAIRMPAGCATSRGVVTARVNDDEFLDVVIGSGCPATPGWLPSVDSCAAAASPDESNASLWVAYWRPDPDEASGRFSGSDPLESVEPLDHPGCTVAALPNEDVHSIVAAVRAKLPAPSGSTEPWPLLLGAADFNGDALPDFVFPDGSVGLSRADPAAPRSLAAAGYLQVPYVSGELWEFALVADFNGNGIPDVIAGHRDRPELVFLNGSPEGVLNEIHIPLVGGPAEVTVGDFDGDLLPDVAFAETGPPDILSVCYGQPFGAPTEPLRIGSLDGIRQIVVGNLSIGGLDGLDDLIVVSEQGSGPTASTRISLLLGSVDRIPFSPFFFTQEAATTSTPSFGDGPEILEVDFGFLASAMAIGELDGVGDSHADVAVLTGPGTRSDSAAWSTIPDYHLWLLPMTGDADIEPLDVTALGFDGFTVAFDPPPVAERALLTALDLGGAEALRGGGQDEVVALATAVGDREDLTTFSGAILVATATDQTTMAGRAVRAFAPTQVIEQLDLLFAGPRLESAGDGQGDVALLDGLAGGRVEAGDVTGDLAADLVVLAGRVDTTDPSKPVLRRTVVAFPNRLVADLAEAIDPNDRIELSAGLPSLEGAAGDPSSFALWNVDQDPEFEVLLLTESGLFLVDVDAALRAPRATTALRAPNGEPLRGGSSLAVGDFDGDRLFDLAVVRPILGSAYAPLELLTGRPSER